MRLSYRNHLTSLVFAVAMATSLPAHSAPTSATSGNLTGTVRIDSGETAAGVDVRLAGTTRRVSTDAEGIFRFDALAPGEYVVEAESPRFGSGVEVARVAPGETAEVEVALGLEIHRESVIITGSPQARAASDLAQPVAKLSDRELLTELRPTLGETLARQPGVNQTFFGPGASRPVIRGVGGDRIRVLESGVGTGDASTTSPDHAVSFDPLSAEEIEVVRGPATLLYGSAATGGVVNLIDRSIPDVAPDRALRGEATLTAASNADARSGGLSLDGGARRFAWHAEASRRDSDDYESGLGVVENSFIEAESANAGASWIGDDGFLGVSLGRFDTTYGNPGEPDAGVFIDMTQKRWDLRGEAHQPFGPFVGAKLRAGGTDYEHSEIEGGEVGTLFLNDSREARFELEHRPLGPIAGTLGAQFVQRKFSALGEEAFVPPTDTDAAAVFLFEEATMGAVRTQFGLRYERQDVSAAPFPAAEEPSDDLPSDRFFSGVSASWGAVWSPSTTYSVAASLSRSTKLPNAEELYSNGPHIATQAFEIGDPDLREETSLGVDLSFRKRAGRFTGEISVFLNRFDDYIFEQFTDDFVEGEEEPLRIVRFTQRDAEFHGGEFSGHFELLHTTQASFDRHLELELSGDTVRAELRDTGEPLPRIPGSRLGLGLRYRSSGLSAGLSVHRVEKQDRISEFETETAGYDSVDASLGYRFFSGGLVHDLSLRGSNLTDEDARSHTSFLKDLALLPGRDVALSYRLRF